MFRPSRYKRGFHEKSGRSTNKPAQLTSLPSHEAGFGPIDWLSLLNCLTRLYLSGNIKTIQQSFITSRTTVTNSSGEEFYPHNFLLYWHLLRLYSLCTTYFLAFLFCLLAWSSSLAPVKPIECECSDQWTRLPIRESSHSRLERNIYYCYEAGDVNLQLLGFTRMSIRSAIDGFKQLYFICKRCAWRLP